MFGMFIFGVSFLRSFYNIYDDENKRVGLALHKWTQASIEEDSKLWIYLLIIGCILIVILAGVYFIKKQRNKKKDEERNR